MTMKSRAKADFSVTADDIRRVFHSWLSEKTKPWNIAMLLKVLSKASCPHPSVACRNHFRG